METGLPFQLDSTPSPTFPSTCPQILQPLYLGPVTDRDMLLLVLLATQGQGGARPQVSEGDSLKAVGEHLERTHGGRRRGHPGRLPG